MSFVRLSVSPAEHSQPAPSATPQNKRKITPSAEKSASKKVLVLTTPTKQPSTTSSGASFSVLPFFPPRQLSPSGEAKIEEECTHAHPEPENKQEPATKNAIWHARHVLLPFDLRDHTVSIDTDDVSKLLLNLFPGTHNVTQARGRSHLIFQVEQLPSSPWPLSIGGVPFTITTDTEGRAFIFPGQANGNPKISICRELSNHSGWFSDAGLCGLAEKLNRYFEESLPNVSILELMHTCEHTVCIVLPNHVVISAVRAKLPGKIANCPVRYFLDQDFKRPAWADLPTKRVIQPNPMTGIIDTTAYDDVRPGVLIRSKMLRDHAHPAIFSTTSGALVKNPTGDVFMTGASHGIGENETVWQADHPERTIAKAEVEISFTDISLLRLEDGVNFVNEPFESEAGVTPKFVRLRTSEDVLNPYTTGYLDCPYTGNMEASVVAQSVRLHGSSSHPTERDLKYVVYDWMYSGQEEGNESKVRPPEGTCGSTIWNEDGLVLGFYRFYLKEGLWAGFLASVSASVLVDMGYKLAK
ncbi:hypothetical protein B0T25DRAFT_530310 [Lasiosphaeria hispida]|uniref:Uncharacterized protein n=1 Tax=Lasiosphaeria hispida TaxID=260671 RepID=A0AAJ0HXK5_9PEZI|nr:hypothetical protein B0T25DRAFT_530310 [Lasiosphaeria hispida]